MTIRTGLHEKPGRSPASALIIAGVLVTLLYILFPSYDYFPDALILAYDIETTPHWLGSPHHPLFPLGPQILFQSLGGLGAGVSGLGVMFAWSVVFGIAALWGMGLIFKRAGFKPLILVTGMALYGFSNAIWYFSTTPNQNSTPLALHVITLLLVVRLLKDLPCYPSASKIVLLSMLVGVSTIASQLNLVLIPPVLYLLWSGEATLRMKIRYIFLFLGALFISIACLWLFLSIFFFGIGSFDEFARWQHSYAYFPAYWVNGAADSMKRSITGALDLHLAYISGGRSLLGKWNEINNSKFLPEKLLVSSGQAVVLIFLAVESVRAVIGWLRSSPRNHLQNLGLLTAVPVLIFTFIFTPEQVHHRVLYLPGFLLFLLPQLERDFRGGGFNMRRALLISSVIISLFLTNFSIKFLPESRLENNKLWSEAVQLGEMFGEPDRIIYLSAYEGDHRIKYTRYFTSCNVTRVLDIVNGIRTDPEGLYEFFREGFRGGGAVVVHSDVLSSKKGYEWVNKRFNSDISPDELKAFFQSWLEPVETIKINDQEYIVFKPRP